MVIFLRKIDLNFANQLLQNGHDYNYVIACARSWANQIDYEISCESIDAIRNERRSY